MLKRDGHQTQSLLDIVKMEMQSELEYMALCSAFDGFNATPEMPGTISQVALVIQGPHPQ